jgi:hypothetical protein
LTWKPLIYESHSNDRESTFLFAINLP